MRALEAIELLDTWERGQGQGGAVRAALLLAAASPGARPEDLLELEISQRDSSLLALRELTFGRRLPAQVGCPACGERLEFELDTRQLRSWAAASREQPAEPAREITAGGYRVRFRLPTGVDLEAAARLPDLADARRALLSRCILEIAPQGAAPEISALTAPPLPPAVEQALAQAIAREESETALQVELVCPACGQGCSTDFDILAYFWQEIEHWAVRLLGEVHQIASAYGWSEESILKMTAWRRQFYLQMIQGEAQP